MEVGTLYHERLALPLQLVFLGKQLDRLLEKKLAERGLNRTQAVVLVALHHRPGLKALELCPHARVEPANVTRTLQSLERMGLLERRSHPTDGRASLFYPTAEGKDSARALARDMETLSTELSGALERQEVEQLEKALSTLRGVVSSRLAAIGDQSC